MWEVQQEYALCVRPVIVRLHSQAVMKITYLMQNVPTEWACDLLGTIVPYDTHVVFNVTDIELFEQVVTYTTVRRLGSPHPRSIGVLHSHHTMGSFFSHVDQDCANENHDLAGVISISPHRNLLLPYEIQFTARIKGACGLYVRVDNVRVEVVPDVELDLDNIKEEVNNEICIPAQVSSFAGTDTPEGEGE